jgi:hypothetical protein
MGTGLLSLSLRRRALALLVVACAQVLAQQTGLCACGAARCRSVPQPGLVIDGAERIAPMATPSVSLPDAAQPGPGDAFERRYRVSRGGGAVAYLSGRSATCASRSMARSCRHHHRASRAGAAIEQAPAAAVAATVPAAARRQPLDFTVRSAPCRYLRVTLGGGAPARAAQRQDVWM